jgi:hypothetical protein
MYDPDGTPVYVGLASESRSRNLVPRLREHFTQQISSVVAYGRIDLLGIWYIEIRSTEAWEAAEDQLIDHFNPVFNRKDPTPMASPIGPDTPDATLTLCDGTERERHREPQNWIRAKLDHIQKMIDSDEVALAGMTRGKKDRIDSAKSAAQYHSAIVERAIDEHYALE